jgi:hypothetical protein
MIIEEQIGKKSSNLYSHRSNNAKYFAEYYVNWNKRIKFPQEISKIKQESRDLEGKFYKMRPDIWY